MITDEQLLSRIAQRDQSAFADLYDRHAGRVLGLLRAILRDDALADDAMQETFWQVWRNASRYDSNRSSAAGWLAMIARSRALDLARQRENRSNGNVEEAVLASVDSTAEVAERESEQVVKHALAGLPAEQRSLIYMAFFCGLTQEQIARQTATALGTVKTRIRRGILRLREELDSQRRALA